MTTHHDVLVIGAGLAGAAAAECLTDAGQRVIVLDKGRGPGGRLSTRRADGGTFDHGAAMLQASSEAFHQWLAQRVAFGVAARWRHGWVGVPGMNALVAAALAGATVQWQAPVASLRLASGGWQARDATGALLAEAVRLIVAIPAPQASTVLRTSGQQALMPWIDALERVRYSPCWAGLFAVDDAGRPASTPVLDEAGTRPSGILEAVYRDADKPGRADVGHWVVHATAGWSEAHLELPPDEATRLMLPAFLDASGREASQVRSATAHRWRYARPSIGARIKACEGMDDLGVWLAGDAIGFEDGDGVPPAERAWRSGRDAALRVLAATQPKS